MIRLLHTGAWQLGYHYTDLIGRKWAEAFLKDSL